MSLRLTESIEDYLEAISILSARNSKVRVKDIASALDVKMPSVNSALKVLKEKDLIKHEAYGKVELTEKGLKQAHDVYIRHKLILHFFQEILDLPYAISNEDACRVEHVLSPETVEKLASFIGAIEGMMENDPGWLDTLHESGAKKRIVMRSGEFIKKGLISLTRAPEGSQVIIKGIDGGLAIKKTLKSMGLVLESVVTVVSHQANQIIIEVKGTRMTLDRKIASKIWGKLA